MGTGGTSEWAMGKVAAMARDIHLSLLLGPGTRICEAMAAALDEARAQGASEATERAAKVALGCGPSNQARAIGKAIADAIRDGDTVKGGTSRE